MKKKLLLAFFVAMLSVMAFANITASAYTYGDLTYKISNGEVIITDCDESATGEMVIPKAIAGYPVTSIGNSAFSDCTGLTSITIPDSVTSIGDQAFAWCQNLTSISVNKENIDYCSQDGVLFSKSKAKIICYPQGKKDTSYTIPGSVTFIGDWAFNYCTGLTKITIPDSVTSIGDWAFNYCTGLTRINIPDSVTSIGDWAFKNCTGLTSITIPDRVTSIGGYVFYNCTGLTSINIGNSVISIGDGAFSNCTGLTSVTIPDSVTTIGESAFLSCTGLTNINIGNSVTSIGNSTFSQCTGLTSINIGNSVTSIGKYAFSDCTGLTSITIGNSVTSIGSYAFSDCTGLTSVIIGDSVTSIGSRAFCWCIRLTSITIPDSVTSIGKEAFSNCKSLTDVYYSGSEEDWNAIKISDYYNDSLLDATIHYNCKPETDEDDDVTDDEPLPNTTRQISAEFIGGQDIVYNADSNSYNKESFTLIGTLENLWQWDDWDREDYSVHNVKVELTLPDGFSFEEASSVQSK
ncbi:MAG: leucine-rich repeat domain-containing protein, partial [Clostridia bacterium]|nr:leucine-rich repeat domain-containing protein [Clostridia bacterium]